MAQFTTLQLASNITSVSVYSKPSVFNGAMDSVLSYSQQLYLKNKRKCWFKRNKKY